MYVPYRMFKHMVDVEGILQTAEERAGNRGNAIRCHDDGRVRALAEKIES